MMRVEDHSLMDPVIQEDPYPYYAALHEQAREAVSPLVGVGDEDHARLGTRPDGLEETEYFPHGHMVGARPARTDPNSTPGRPR